MKRVLIALVVAGALMLSGCMEILTFNLFDGMGRPETPASADEVTNILEEAGDDPDAVIDTLSDLASSRAFFEDLDTMDEAQKQEVIDTVTEALADIYTSTDADVTNEQKAEAAILTAEIYLASNEEAQEVVNSVVDVAFEAFQNDDLEALASVEEVVVDLLEDAFGSVENLDAALDALSGAADAYTFYGFTLEDADFNADILAYAGASRRVSAMDFGGDEPNTGAIAQNALVAIAINIFRVTYVEYYGAPISELQDILDVVQDLTASTPSGGTNQDLINDVMTELMENQAFLNILAAANIPFLDDFDFGGDDGSES